MYCKNCKQYTSVQEINFDVDGIRITCSLCGKTQRLIMRQSINAPASWLLWQDTTIEQVITTQKEPKP